MIKITCGICEDLMPLVQDGIASEDSRQALRRHIESCPSCQAMFQGELPPSDGQDILGQKILWQLKHKVRLFSLMALMCGVFLGLCLTGSSGMFYNTLIMPLIGAVGYCLFRWKAIYTIPLLLLIFYPIATVASMILSGEMLDVYSTVSWTVIYSIFALTGTAIAGLLHFAFRRDQKPDD